MDLQIFKNKLKFSEICAALPPALPWRVTQGVVILGFIGSGRFLATAISGLAAVAILSLAAWMLLGSDDQPGQVDGAVRIIPPAAAAAIAEPADAVAVSRSADAAAAPAEIAVYLTGEVVNPGVYVAAPGQRLDAVLKLAGGPTERADLNRVNLAAYVTDAAHYRIPAVAETDAGAVNAALPAGDAVVGSEPAAAPCAVPVDINTASAECLDTLPGIGSVRADSIVRHREHTGPFVTADGIIAVSGIGSGTYGRIADLITVNAR